jgi:hypothetical protein
LQGIRVVLNDGAAHAVDSNEMAFRLAAIGGFRQAYASANPAILEPIMKVGLSECIFVGLADVISLFFCALRAGFCWLW